MRYTKKKQNMAPLKFMMSESLMYGARISKPKEMSIKQTLKTPRRKSGIGLSLNAENSRWRETSMKQGNTVTSPNRYMMDTTRGCH